MRNIRTKRQPGRPRHCIPTVRAALRGRPGIGALDIRASTSGPSTLGPGIGALDIGAPGIGALDIRASTSGPSTLGPSASGPSTSGPSISGAPTSGSFLAKPELRVPY